MEFRLSLRFEGTSAKLCLQSHQTIAVLLLVSIFFEKFSALYSLESEDDMDENLTDILSPGWFDKIITKFVDWLRSVDGGHKKERSAKQRASQVASILKRISPDEFLLSELFNRQLIRDSWLTVVDLIYEPGTIRTYLNSLRQFYDYLLCDKPSSCSATTQEICSMISITKNWSSGYKKKVKIRKFQKQLDDLPDLLKPEELHEYDHSNLVEESRLLIKKLSLKGRPPLLQQFTSCRDYILTSLILSNATRPGALQNMTLKEFENASLASTGSYTVYVMDHKTIATSGPAVIVFTKFLHGECAMYIKHIRNQLPGISTLPDDPLFISWTGRKMSSSLLGDQFSAYFKRATKTDLEQRAVRKLTSTLVRKAFVSKVHSEKQEHKKDLANMMNHGPETAARSYFLESKSRNVAHTFKIMQQTMRSTPEDLLKVTFQDKLASNVSIVMEDVRKKWDSIKQVNLTEKQILDKLRHIQSKITSFDATNTSESSVNKEKPPRTKNQYAEDDNDSDYSGSETVPTSEASDISRDGGRITYLPHEEASIQKAFSKLIKGCVNIRKKEVCDILETYTDLQQIRVKYGWYRILVKVRTERRKYATKY